MTEDIKAPTAGSVRSRIEELNTNIDALDEAVLVLQKILEPIVRDVPTGPSNRDNPNPVSSSSILASAVGALNMRVVEVKNKITSLSDRIDL